MKNLEKIKRARFITILLKIRFTFFIYNKNIIYRMFLYCYIFIVNKCNVARRFACFSTLKIKKKDFKNYKLKSDKYSTIQIYIGNRWKKKSGGSDQFNQKYYKNSGLF